MLSAQLISLYCAIFRSVQGQSEAKVRLIYAQLKWDKAGPYPSLKYLHHYFAMQHLSRHKLRRKLDIFRPSETCSITAK
jgi:hypothetical protein